MHENINKLKATDRVKDQPQVYTNNPKDTQVQEKLQIEEEQAACCMLHVALDEIFIGGESGEAAWCT